MMAVGRNFLIELNQQGEFDIKMKRIFALILFVLLPNLEHATRILFYLMGKECMWTEKILNQFFASYISLSLEVGVLLTFVICRFFRGKTLSLQNTNSLVFVGSFCLGQLIHTVAWISSLYDCLLDR